MTVSNNYNIAHNVGVYARFEALARDGKNPVLGVYRDKHLVILSTHMDGVCSCLTQSVKKIFYCILALFGAIKQEAPRINELKAEINRYHYDHITENMPQEAGEVTRREGLTRECTALQNQINTQTPEAERIREVIRQGEEAARKLEEHRSTIRELENMETRIPGLREVKIGLELEIEMRGELLQQIKTDTAQVDYRAQVIQLKKELEEAKRNVDVATSQTTELQKREQRRKIIWEAYECDKQHAEASGRKSTLRGPNYSNGLLYYPRRFEFLREDQPFASELPQPATQQLTNVQQRNLQATITHMDAQFNELRASGAFRRDQEQIGF